MGLFDLLKGGKPEDKFAERVMRRLRERGWPHDLNYDKVQFTLAVGGDSALINLGNLYRDWLRYPKADQEQALVGRSTSSSK